MSHEIIFWPFSQLERLLPFKPNVYSVCFSGRVSWQHKVLREGSTAGPLLTAAVQEPLLPLLQKHLKALRKEWGTAWTGRGRSLNTWSFFFSISVRSFLGGGSQEFRIFVFLSLYMGLTFETRRTMTASYKSQDHPESFYLRGSDSD